MAKLAIFPEDRYTLPSFSKIIATNNVQQQLRSNRQARNKSDGNRALPRLRHSLMTAAERSIQSSLMTAESQQQQQQPIIKPENLPLVSICKGRGRRPTEVEVIYNSMHKTFILQYYIYSQLSLHPLQLSEAVAISIVFTSKHVIDVQPTNVCQGCIDGNRFCYFEARGPKARLRRCTACVEKHLPCVMKTSRKKTSSVIMPDPQGDLIVPLAFKNYFLQYRRAQYVVKHPNRFPVGSDGLDKVKEAGDIVRRFRPVSLLTLKRYSCSTSRHCSATTTTAAASPALKIPANSSKVQSNTISNNGTATPPHSIQ
ncbi:hypothetical protein BDB00DRAFT_800303 [Zychaea mexicana]|uniref:uncharacterized protein n=1 Tax=Zychaea mexicana TaxID=64656 RepID=UPI0022FE0291|nr:uncharacterized protein BDB00DRAFT_800303 [Zychaea mexicana]KAI9498441.1 hypothetical protein BDB00DRAFT_800303 [Zychaea mexicana]